MKSFCEFFESKNYGLLYHYTSIENLLRILDEKRLYSFYISSEVRKSLKYNYYISTTRNNLFHKTTHHLAKKKLQCRLVLDGNEISNNYKIVPFNYFDAQSKLSFNESEEAILVNKEMTNLDRYIKSVEIINYDDFYDYIEHTIRILIITYKIREHYDKKILDSFKYSDLILSNGEIKEKIIHYHNEWRKLGYNIENVKDEWLDEICRLIYDTIVNEIRESYDVKYF